MSRCPSIGTAMPGGTNAKGMTSEEKRDVAALSHPVASKSDQGCGLGHSYINFKKHRGGTFVNGLVVSVASPMFR